MDNAAKRVIARKMLSGRVRKIDEENKVKDLRGIK